MENDRLTMDAEVAAAHKQTATVAGALVGALIMYVVVAEVLVRAPVGNGPPAFLGPLRIALFVTAGVAIFATTIVKGMMLRSVPADTTGRLARLRTATLTALALGELPAVSGLVLLMIGGIRSDFYMLLAISTYMMVRHFPRRGAWEEYMQRSRATGAR